MWLGVVNIFIVYALHKPMVHKSLQHFHDSLQQKANNVNAYSDERTKASLGSACGPRLRVSLGSRQDVTGGQLFIAQFRRQSD